MKPWWELPMTQVPSYQRIERTMNDEHVNYRTPEVEARLDNDFKYHPPTESQTERYEQLRYTARGLAYMIATLAPPSPERSTALRLVSEAVMNANAAIARNEPGPQRSGEDAPTAEGLPNLPPSWSWGGWQRAEPVTTTVEPSYPHITTFEVRKSDDRPGYLFFIKAMLVADHDFWAQFYVPPPMTRSEHDTLEELVAIFDPTYTPMYDDEAVEEAKTEDPGSDTVEPFPMLPRSRMGTRPAMQTRSAWSDLSRHLDLAEHTEAGWIERERAGLDAENVRKGVLDCCMVHPCVRHRGHPGRHYVEVQTGHPGDPPVLVPTVDPGSPSHPFVGSDAERVAFEDPPRKSDFTFVRDVPAVMLAFSVPADTRGKLTVTPEEIVGVEPGKLPSEFTCKPTESKSIVVQIDTNDNWEIVPCVVEGSGDLTPLIPLQYSHIKGTLVWLLEGDADASLPSPRYYGDRSADTDADSPKLHTELGYFEQQEQQELVRVVAQALVDNGYRTGMKDRDASHIAEAVRVFLQSGED